MHKEKVQVEKLGGLFYATDRSFNLFWYDELKV